MKVFEGFLTLLSVLYGGLCRIRAFLYRSGFFKVRRLEAVVISVGNLTAGGTGKTPLVIALGEFLRQQGLKVGVLSRGYKGRRQQDLQWVSDGQKLLSGPSKVGDEPCLIAGRLKDVPVLVGKDRFRAGRAMVERFKPDVILLDDGFQHLKLYRDVNLLVMDAAAPFGPAGADGRLLPRGRLREPVDALRRASAVLVSFKGQDERYPGILRRIREIHPDVPVFQAFFRALGLVHAATEEKKTLEDLKDQPILAFSGIGRPGSFRHFLEDLKAKVILEEIFRDHHFYTSTEIRHLLDQARSAGAKWLVTTEKDAVKVRELIGPDEPVWALRIGLDRIEDGRVWESFIREHATAN